MHTSVRDVAYTQSHTQTRRFSRSSLMIRRHTRTSLLLLKPHHFQLFFHTYTNSYEQLLSDATKRGMAVPGLVSAAMAPYVQSMYAECLSPRCTERCTVDGIGNLTVAEEYEGLTGFYVGISGWVRVRGESSGGGSSSSSSTGRSMPR